MFSVGRGFGSAADLPVGADQIHDLRDDFYCALNFGIAGPQFVLDFRFWTLEDATFSSGPARARWLFSAASGPKPRRWSTQHSTCILNIDRQPRSMPRC
jgi:hypothetical protein